MISNHKDMYRVWVFELRMDIGIQTLSTLQKSVTKSGAFTCYIKVMSINVHYKYILKKSLEKNYCFCNVTSRSIPWSSCHQCVLSHTQQPFVLGHGVACGDEAETSILEPASPCPPANLCLSKLAPAWQKRLELTDR